MVLTSCAPSGEKSNSRESLKSNLSKEVFQSGKIYPKVNCVQKPSYSYTLFLPENYRTGTPSPVVFFFDAHARGWLPVEKYKSLADSLGYILVASNDSKNGQTSSLRNEIIYAFMADVEQRFSIDSRRIYTAGFSGGARIASGIGLANQNIAGVIGCAAGFPQLSQVPRTDLTYVGIVGNQDFNYLEMMTLDQRMEANHEEHFMLVFDGKHDWPPAKIMNRAFFFMEMDAMRKNRTSKNKQQIVKIKLLLEQDRDKAIVLNDIWQRYKADQQLVAFLSGLAPVQSYQAEMKNISQSDSFQELQHERFQLLRQESKSQQELSKALQIRDKDWWQKEIAQIYKNIKNAGNNESRLMNRRLLNYLSLMSYLYADGNLKQGQANAAVKYLMIYERVDPTNPEVYFLKAQQKAMLGKSAREVYPALEKAVHLGFDAVDRLNKMSYFASFRQTTHFQELAKQVLINQKYNEKYPK